jgi:hypothetical protein
MSDAELPLASPVMEEQARAMAAEGLSPQEYAARQAHRIGSFSLDEYRYRDPGIQEWIRKLGDILFRRPGAPSLDELRNRLLTAEERAAIREEEKEEF